MPVSRVLAAIVVLPAVGAFILGAPVWAFALVVAGVGAIALGELHRLLDPASPGPTPLALMVGLAVGTPVAFAPEPAPVVAALGLGGVALWLGALGRRAPPDTALPQAAISAFALLYVVLPLALLIRLRAASAGLVAVVVLGTWGRDVGAFFGGRLLRGRALRADLNPGKHGPGALAGFLGSGLVVAVMASFLPTGPDTWDAFAVAAIIGLLGQAGDLFESMLKRRAGERHSGRWLGSQGGVLDSIDGMLFTTPAVAVYWLLKHGRGFSPFS
jgi:phosphatidate cytidylyltransferase